MKIREIYEAKVKVISEDKDKNVMNIMVPFIQAGEKNRNGRTYPESLLKREIARVQGSVKSGSFIGVGDHPSSGIENIATASHIVTKLSLDEKGKGMAELRILPTERGKTIQTLIKNDAQLGVSIRGFGDVGKDGTVQSNYKLVGLDVVLNPSFKGAFFDKSNIFESEFSEKKEDKKMKDKLMGLSQEYVDGIMKDCYEFCVKDDGFKGSFANWKKHFGNAYLAELLIQEGKFETAEEALEYLNKNKHFEEKQTNALDTKTYLGATEMGFKGTWQEWETLLGHPVDEPVQKLTEEAIQARTYSYYQEAVNSGYQGDFNTWKEKFPKIVEQAKEKKVVLSEKKEEPKAPFKSKCSWAEIQLSGFLGTIQEYQEQFPDITILKPESPEKPIVEKTLKERAGIIFAGMMKDNPKSSIVLEDIIKLLEKEEIATADKRLRQKAIYIVNASIVGSGSVPTQEMLEKMVEMEIENLKEQRKEMREKNWQVYKKLLSE